MTAKEKASELIEKHRAIIRKSDVYDHLSYRFMYLSKQCALIAVELLIKELEECSIYSMYWKQVKTEIENL